MSNEYDRAYEAGYRDGSIHYELDHCPACKNIADLQEALDENAKLRELCKDMMAFVEDDDACELVLPYEGRCLMLNLFADRMRELGVEVDG